MSKSTHLRVKLEIRAEFPIPENTTREEFEKKFWEEYENRMDDLIERFMNFKYTFTDLDII